MSIKNLSNVKTKSEIFSNFVSFSEHKNLIPHLKLHNHICSIKFQSRQIAVIYCCFAARGFNNNGSKSSSVFLHYSALKLLLGCNRHDDINKQHFSKILGKCTVAAFIRFHCKLQIESGFKLFVNCQGTNPIHDTINRKLEELA